MVSDGVGKCGRDPILELKPIEPLQVVIDGFEERGLPHIKMAIGGAPISQMFADEIGADGYGQNASAAVDLFLKLAGERENGDLPDPVLAGDPVASQG